MSSSTSYDGLGAIREVWPIGHDVAGLIGQTPLIEVARLFEAHEPRIYVKHEGSNPGGSIRDRTVLEILDNAAASGLLYRGDELVMAGASNSAVSAAMIANVRGYPVAVFHPEGATERLLHLLTEAGATIERTPEVDGMEGAVDAAADYAQEHSGRIFIDAGRREALTDAIHHIAREIVTGLSGRSLGAFVTSVSTGATLRHVARELRKHYPELIVVGVRIQTPPERESFYDDVATPITWSPLGEVEAELIEVTEVEAWSMRQRAVRRTGLLLGPKGASALIGAQRLRDRVAPDQAIIALSIDGGQRYFGAEPPEVRAALAAQP
jgi:cysteine synthase A